jgi:hypothetical protein
VRRLPFCRLAEGIACNIAAESMLTRGRVDWEMQAVQLIHRCIEN